MTTRSRSRGTKAPERTARLVVVPEDVDLAIGLANGLVQPTPFVTQLQ